MKIDRIGKQTNREKKLVEIQENVADLVRGCLTAKAVHNQLYLTSKNPRWFIELERDNWFLDALGVYLALVEEKPEWFGL